MGQLADQPVQVPEGEDRSNYVVDVRCYPFFDILKALGNPTIDYFSLDIEGFEMKVRTCKIITRDDQRL